MEFLIMLPLMALGIAIPAVYAVLLYMIYIKLNSIERIFSEE